jgi:hypothetical protein
MTGRNSAEPKLVERAGDEDLLGETGQPAEGADGFHLALNPFRERSKALVEQMEENRAGSFALSFLETFSLPFRLLLLWPSHPHRSGPPTVALAENFILRGFSGCQFQIRLHEIQERGPTGSGREHLRKDHVPGGR